MNNDNLYFFWPGHQQNSFVKMHSAVQINRVLFWVIFTHIWLYETYVETWIVQRWNGDYLCMNDETLMYGATLDHLDFFFFFFVAPCQCLPSHVSLLGNRFSQKHLCGISPNLVHMSNWSRGWTDSKFWGQRSRSLWPHETRFWA